VLAALAQSGQAQSHHQGQGQGQGPPTSNSNYEHPQHQQQQQHQHLGGVSSRQYAIAQVIAAVGSSSAYAAAVGGGQNLASPPPPYPGTHAHGEPNGAPMHHGNGQVYMSNSALRASPYAPYQPGRHHQQVHKYIYASVWYGHPVDVHSY
jgi:hypothetical protein